MTMILCCLAACKGGGSAGTLRTESLGREAIVLPGDYVAAFFANDPNSDASFMLSDVPLDDVVQGKVVHAQLLHIQLLWTPKPGSTPMDPSATNASVRYVVIADGEVGVYGGAGFANPGDSLQGKTVTLTLREASVRLLESTPGFMDRLSPAQMSGTFTARRDEKKTRQLNYAVSQLVTNALGKTQYVMR